MALGAARLRTALAENLSRADNSCERDAVEAY
jgi:hypothetical protein